MYSLFYILQNIETLTKYMNSYVLYFTKYRIYLKFLPSSNENLAQSFLIASDFLS